MTRCPRCYVADAATHPGVLHVVTADGVSHAVPVLWFADTRARLESTGVLPSDAIRGAYLAWAATCVQGRAS